MIPRYKTMVFISKHITPSLMTHINPSVFCTLTNFDVEEFKLNIREGLIPAVLGSAVTAGGYAFKQMRGRASQLDKERERFIRSLSFLHRSLIDLDNRCTDDHTFQSLHVESPVLLVQPSLP